MEETDLSRYEDEKSKKELGYLSQKRKMRKKKEEEQRVLVRGRQRWKKTRKARLKKIKLTSKNHLKKNTSQSTPGRGGKKKRGRQSKKDPGPPEGKRTERLTVSERVISPLSEKEGAFDKKKIGHVPLPVDRKRKR